MNNKQWSEVTSGRLLKRMAQRGLISEPPPEDRPTLPSKRIWGKGYNYVTIVDGSPLAWDFEGSHYQIIKKDNKLYVWRTEISHHQQR